MTGLRPGSPYDVALNREAARRIEQEYQGSGIQHCRSGEAACVVLSKTEREVVFQIVEGKKVTVADVEFIGNKDISSRVSEDQAPDQDSNFEMVRREVRSVLAHR